MNTNSTALSISGITKKFGNFTAVNDLSLELPGGIICGLLGPNGAGKTTAIRMIMNIIIPDSGRITIFGNKLDDNIKNQIGYLPEERGLYPKMKVQDVLEFFAGIKDIPKKEAKDIIEYWLVRLQIADWKDKKVDELSKGMQQKIQVIVTLLNNPQLLILDEPFSGFDPINIELFKDIILELKQNGKTILFSTHIMEHAEKLCDDICLINKGKNILSGRLSQIKQDFGKNTVILKYHGDGSVFKNSPDIEKHNDYGNYIELEFKENVNTQNFLKDIVNKVEIQKFEIMEPSLNQIFIESVEKSGNKAAE
ncbi:ABC transporter ATP-binding protein [candidate division KSB1 bacterium]